jgi:hypothetical protein
MPPVPEDLVRVHLNFSVGIEEIAVSTFHLHLNRITGSTTDWPVFTQIAADLTVQKWKQRMTNVAQFPAGLSLRDVAAYHLNAADGKTLHKGSAPATGANAWAGTATKSLPLECATAVSLFGYGVGQFVPDRARRRGRMYLPPLSTDVMDDGTPGHMGRLQAGNHNVLQGAVGAFFDDIHGMIGDLPAGDRFDLVVVSRTGNFFTPVTRVSVGDVVDVQRRRRNGQPETYKHTVLTPSGQ